MMTDQGGSFRWDLAVVLVLAAVSLLCVGGALRESDQAALLDGAVRIATGETSMLASPAYNYDKTFLSYWLVAGVWNWGNLIGSEREWDTIAFGENLLASAIFWVAVTVLVARRRGKFDPLAFSLLLGALLGGSLWMNASLFSPNVVSAGFFLLLAAVLGIREGTRPIRSRLVAAVLTFAAVAARADAVLALPFLCWVSVRGSSFSALVRAPRHWWMAGGAVVALVLGALIATGQKMAFFPPVTMLKMILAYLVFGFGGGLPAFLVMLGIVAGGAALTKNRAWFFLAGAGFALISLAFYGFQLYTPRHLLMSLLLVIVFVTGWRGRVLLRLYRRRLGRKSTVLAAMLVLAAVLPFCVGVHLPVVNRPRAVLSEATLFPTTDGLWPMGAYGWFTLKQKHAARDPIDHNQAIWRSLGGVQFDTADDGRVPIFGATLLSYFRLAATLQGKTAHNVAPDDLMSKPFLYGDERQLRRSTKTIWAGVEFLRDETERLKAMPKTVVSAPGAQPAVLRLVPGGDPATSNPEVEQRLVLAGVFGGNEFRCLPGPVTGLKFERADRGKVVVLYSEGPFEALLRGGESAGERRVPAEPLDFRLVTGGEGRMFLVRLGAEETLQLMEVAFTNAGKPVSAARAVLPAYMSVGGLR